MLANVFSLLASRTLALKLRQIWSHYAEHSRSAA
jgi:hypothetical protein